MFNSELNSNLVKHSSSTLYYSASANEVKEITFTFNDLVEIYGIEKAESEDGIFPFLMYYPFTIDGNKLTIKTYQHVGGWIGKNITLTVVGK